MLTLLDRAERRFPATDKFKVTQSLIDEIRKEGVEARERPVKIAAKLGVPVGLVRYITNELPNPVSEFTKHSDDGWGRKDLRDFIIGRKQSGDDWPDTVKTIMEEKRKLYDEGLIELVQGRDADFIIQYAIPRKKKARRLDAYFVIGTECDD